ncbi:MAG: chalcone isomerase family protein [Sulfurospirillaceae bacterium]|nr:chalcone isomerase family protein [Sulfurospirillaceae bacterium]
MNKFIKIAAIVCLLSCSSVFGAKISGIKIPDSIQNNTLVLNGAGIRSKFFFDLYVGALYLKKKTKNAQEIINANEPMDITLYITSSLISSDKMTNGTMEGFEKSTDGHIKPIKQEISQFLAVFTQKIRNGDIYDFSYVPGVGVKIYKNNKFATTIEGLKFKKALFGIWLCNKPAQKSLKKKMLGI